MSSNVGVVQSVPMLNQVFAITKPTSTEDMWHNFLLIIVLCRLVVRVHCQSLCTTQYSVVQCN
jgi:hypothetical protein